MRGLVEAEMSKFRLGSRLAASVLGRRTTNGFGTPGNLPLAVMVGPQGVVRAIHMPDHPDHTRRGSATGVHRRCASLRKQRNS